MSCHSLKNASKTRCRNSPRRSGAACRSSSGASPSLSMRSAKYLNAYRYRVSRGWLARLGRSASPTIGMSVHLDSSAIASISAGSRSPLQSHGRRDDRIADTVERATRPVGHGTTLGLSRSRGQPSGTRTDDGFQRLTATKRRHDAHTRRSAYQRPEPAWLEGLSLDLTPKHRDGPEKATSSSAVCIQPHVVTPKSPSGTAHDRRASERREWPVVLLQDGPVSSARPDTGRRASQFI